MIAIANVTRQTMVVSQAEEAVRWPDRMIGLLRRNALQPGEALVIHQCHAIHTWGMRFAFDAIFIDRKWKIVALESNVHPWRLVGPMWSASAVIEAADGTIERSRSTIGDQLQKLEA